MLSLVEESTEWAAVEVMGRAAGSLIKPADGGERKVESLKGESFQNQACVCDVGV